HPAVLSVRRDGALGAVPRDEEPGVDTGMSGHAPPTDTTAVADLVAPVTETATDSLTSLLLLVDYSGDERGMADLVALLVSNGVMVSRFAEQSSDLEDIFMQVTKGIVQ